VTLQWLAADLATGLVRADLTTFEPQWPLRHPLSDDDADAAKAIMWAGYVTLTDPDTGTDAVALSLSTVEGYLSRRYVPDVTYTAGTLRDDIIVDVVNRWVTAGIGPIPGVPVPVHKVGSGGPPLPADRVWQNTDNATVKARIDELHGEFGGEYSASWTWADGQHLAVTLYVGDHIGAVSTTGIPAVTFEQPGPIVSVKQPTDYGDGAGANVVTAYSSGQGSVTPYAPPVTVTDPAGRPVFEYRYQPVASEIDPAVLARHSQQALAVLGPGARPLALTLAIEELVTGRRLGADWRVGDDVGYHVEPCNAFVAGLDGTARVIAVEIGGDATGPTTVTPVFAQPEIYTGAGA
jgi:hypothetical protein